MMNAFDMVVVGGGLAGLAAATRGAEQGLTVALLEQGAEERYLCNSRFAAGFLNCGYRHNIIEPPELLRRAIDDQTRGFADAALAEAFANHAGEAVRWLTAQGIRLVSVYVDGNKRRAVMAPPPPNKPGLHWQGRGTDVMVRKLAARLEAHGGKIYRGTRARELLMREGRCVGVIAHATAPDNTTARRESGADASTPISQGAHALETPLEFTARAVVIADGGYQANLDLMRQYVSPAPEKLLQRNAQTAKGDGLRMALAAGAAVRGMGRFYGHLHARDALTQPLLWPNPVVDTIVAAGMAVNREGARFCDEGLGGVFVANTIAALADPLSTFAIFDDAIWRGRATLFARPANPGLQRAGATIHHAYSLDELAQKAGIHAQTLLDTVATYNRAVTAGNTATLDIPRSATAIKPLPIYTPPFYAIPLCAGVTYTMGGIAIDARSRVLRESGEVISGLYAAGSCTGGHEGGPVAGYTGGLSKALTFGWLAANDIAAG